MAKAITSEKFQIGTSTDPVRFAFLSLDKARQVGKNPKPTDPKKWQATGLLDPKNETHARQLATLQEMAKELLRKGGIDPEELKSKCFGKGDLRKKDGKVYDGFEGMVWVGLAQNEEKRGDILIGNRMGQEVMPGEKGFPYSGAYGIIKGTLWLQDNDWGKRINGNLLVVQFIKDGPAFGNAKLNPDEEFERLPDEGGGGAKSGGVKETASSDWL